MKEPASGEPRPARRHEPRYARSDLTLANAFTAARIVLVPVFAEAWYHGDGARALWAFGVAAATDLVDGFLARFLNQRSRLGALLDPMADKLLVFVALVVGVLLGAIPFWFAALIVGRDFLILVGAVLFATAWKHLHGPASWRPTRVGKYAMAMQSLAIVLVILDTSLTVDLRPYVEVALVFTAALTITAFAQYLLRAALAFVRPPEDLYVKRR